VVTRWLHVEPLLLDAGLGRGWSALRGRVWIDGGRRERQPVPKRRL